MNSKPICVFGCQIGTKAGIAIKANMMSWLRKFYNVITVDVGLSNKTEFPFIAQAIMTCIRKNEPVLYIHTKGACNQNSAAFDLNKRSGVNIPDGATPEDNQKIVRAMWKHEFTVNMDKYLSAVSGETPMVAAPYSGDKKTTWHNGFFMNPAAAIVLTKTFHFDKNRFYYEQMFRKTDIPVIGIRMNDVPRKPGHQANMWQDLWDNFYLGE